MGVFVGYVGLAVALIEELFASATNGFSINRFLLI
jgi:hypothetical protein